MVTHQSIADGGNHFARFLDKEAEVSEIDGAGYDKYNQGDLGIFSAGGFEDWVCSMFVVSANVLGQRRHAVADHLDRRGRRLLIQCSVRA